MKKMKNINTISIMKLLFLSLFYLSFSGFAQTEKSLYTIGLANVSNTSNTLEMDVTITIDSPTNSIKLAQISVGINYDSSILNDGTPCNLKNCGSWIYIGGKSSAINGLKTTINTADNSYGHLRIIGTPLDYNSSIDVKNGTYTLGRYRFINTVAWKNNSNAQLWLQPSNIGNKTNTIISSYRNNNTSKKLIAYTVASRKNNKSVSLQYTIDAPLNYVLNDKLINDNPFIAFALPNPFSDNFHLEIQTSVQNPIQMRVYDMLGKQIENRSIEIADLQNLALGSNYPSGIYTVSLTQAEKTQTLRIIKR